MSVFKYKILLKKMLFSEILDICLKVSEIENEFNYDENYTIVLYGLLTGLRPGVFISINPYNPYDPYKDKEGYRIFYKKILPIFKKYFIEYSFSDFKNGRIFSIYNYPKKNITTNMVKKIGNLIGYDCSSYDFENPNSINVSFNIINYGGRYDIRGGQFYGMKCPNTETNLRKQLKKLWKYTNEFNKIELDVELKIIIGKNITTYWYSNSKLIINQD